MNDADVAELRRRKLPIPVEGVAAAMLVPTFHQARGEREHEALDILAPRGTAVIAVEDGRIAKLFTSVPGGLTDLPVRSVGRYCYYYAHLDQYADRLHDGQDVVRGEVIGYVGTTGNAPPNTPHLHFAVFKLGPEKRWWQGTPIDPYLDLALRRSHADGRRCAVHSEPAQQCDYNAGHCPPMIHAR